MKPVFRVADGAPFQGSVMRLHISGHHEWCLFFQCLITSPTDCALARHILEKNQEYFLCQILSAKRC